MSGEMGRNKLSATRTIKPGALLGSQCNYRIEPRSSESG